MLNLQLTLRRRPCATTLIYSFFLKKKNTKWDSDVTSISAAASDGEYLNFLGCVRHCGRMCVHVCESTQTQNSPYPTPTCLCAVASSPPPSSRLWLGRSWGLTFHFSDPLFYRANSDAGLEICCVAGWDKKIKAASKIIHETCRRFFFFFSPLYLCFAAYFDDIISIMNL